MARSDSKKKTQRGGAQKQVTVNAQDIVDGNKTIQGDEVGGDKVLGDKVTHIHQNASHTSISQAEYDAAQRAYLKIVIERTELLEFIGIPEHGKRQRDEIKLEDIFIPLGIEERIVRGTREFAESGAEEDPLIRAGMALGGTLDAIIKRVPLEVALRNHAHMMVVGDPGAGKSTLLRYLTLVAATERAADRGQTTEEGESQIEGEHKASPLREKRMPILIPLRRFAASEEKSLVDYFYVYVKQAYQLDLPTGFFERALDAGECLVCMDGLDEVVLTGQRMDVRHAVASLTSRYSRNRFIVTSRIVGYEQAPLDRRVFAHHTVMPFTKEEIESFVRKWYHARERNENEAKSQADALVKTIQENDRLLKLAENPLMLTIIALVHRIEAELPNERVKLYDKCTEALLATWENVKGLGISEQERERPYYKFRRRLLEKLAFWMHTLSQDHDHQAEVKSGDLELKLIELLREDDKVKLSTDEARLEAQTFLEMAKSRTGILVERGDGVYSFLHLTFQEYFAACDIESRYIYDLEKMWGVIQLHLYDARWQEVILLLLGRLNRYDDPPTILLQKILDEQDRFDEVVYRNLRLATRCLADKVNVRETLHDQIVDKLLGLVYATHPTLWSPGDDTFPILKTLTNDLRAANGLLTIAQDATVAAGVRRDAVQALAQLGRPDDIVLHGLLVLAQDATVAAGVRRDAAQALAQFGRPNDAIPLLLALAQDATVDASVQSTALALAQLGSPDDAILLLLDLAQDDTVDADVRSAAAQALGTVGQKQPSVALGLLELAKSKSAEVRSGAYQGLREMVGNLRYADLVKQTKPRRTRKAVGKKVKPRKGVRKTKR